MTAAEKRAKKAAATAAAAAAAATQGATDSDSSSSEGASDTQGGSEQQGATQGASSDSDPQPSSDSAPTIGALLEGIGSALLRPRWYESAGRWVQNSSPTALQIGLADDSAEQTAPMLTITRSACPEERGEVGSAPAIPESRRTPAAMRTDDGGARFSLPFSALETRDGRLDREALVALVVALLVGVNQKAESSADSAAAAAAKTEREQRKALGAIGATLRRAFGALKHGPKSPRAVEGFALFAPNPLDPSDSPAAPALAAITAARAIGFAPDASLLALGAAALEAMSDTPLESSIRSALELLTAASEPSDSDAPSDSDTQGATASADTSSSDSAASGGA